MTANSQRISIGQDDLAASEHSEILAELDAISAESAALPTPSQAVPDAHKAMIKEAAKAYGYGGSKNGFDYERYKARVAEQARLKYRADKCAEGKTVRSYRFNDLSPDERKEERAKAAKAAYAIKVGRPVRTHENLKDRSSAERKERSRILARERQRKRRLAMKADPESDDFGMF